MEERDEEMNAMFHLVLSGHEGFGEAAVEWGGGAVGAPEMCATFSKAAVAQDLRRPGAPDSTRRRWTPVSPASNTARYVDTWQSVTVMANNRPLHTHTHRLRHLRAPSHRALGRAVSDGFAIDRATEIIKCCPTGSSIKS